MYTQLTFLVEVGLLCEAKLRADPGGGGRGGSSLRNSIVLRDAEEPHSCPVSYSRL